MVLSGDVRESHLIHPREAIAAHRDGAIFLEVIPWRDAEGADPIDGSIPGAYAAYVADDFAGAGGGPEGHLPLPAIEDLRRRLNVWGVHRSATPVILYTRTAGAFNSAARAWFVLRWAGATEVRVLDGQLPGWTSAGGTLSALSATPPDSDSNSPTDTGSWASPGSLPTLDADEASETAEYGTLLDARPYSAYDGNPDDPQSGHIPGAFSAPASEISDNGRLLPGTELRKWFLRHRAIGPRAGAYCGGGVASAGLVFAAASIGEELPLYVASWSGWSAIPDFPVERKLGAVATASEETC